MFFEEQQNYTIDEINFSSFPPLSQFATNFPYELASCISNATIAQDINEIKKIFETVVTKSSDQNLREHTIDQIYFSAIASGFSVANMEALLKIIPIDINRSVNHVFRGMCQPPVLKTDSPLNLAVAFDRADLVELFITRGADLNQCSHDNETPQQELERAISQERQAENPYNLEVKERMLQSILSANQHSNSPEESTSKYSL